MPLEMSRVYYCLDAKTPTKSQCPEWDRRRKIRNGRRKRLQRLLGAKCLTWDFTSKKEAQAWLDTLPDDFRKHCFVSKRAYLYF